MSFSKEWEQKYIEKTNMSIWPWSDLVSYVMRYTNISNRQGLYVLELGCGAGANIPLFLSLNANYYAVDGSETIVQWLHKKFPDMKDRIKQADFTEHIPFEIKFDLVVDRASVSCNSTVAIQRCLANICKNNLKKGGAYIGIDWYSTEHSEYEKGKTIEDINTKEDYRSGVFAGVGRIHFSNRSHLEGLFRGFQIEVLEHKIVNKQIPFDNAKFATWNFVATKK